jgi:hypothetical protein
VSKFSGIFEAAKDQSPAPRQKRTPKASARAAATVSSRRRGRPPGKRSDPDYEAITAYIRKDTHRDVKITLLQMGHGQEFSELVEELLAKWLKLKST